MNRFVYRASASLVMLIGAIGLGHLIGLYQVDWFVAMILLVANVPMAGLVFLTEPERRGWCPVSRRICT